MTALLSASSFFYVGAKQIKLSSLSVLASFWNGSAVVLYYHSWFVAATDSAHAKIRVISRQLCLDHGMTTASPQIAFVGPPLPYCVYCEAVVCWLCTFDTLSAVTVFLSMIHHNKIPVQLVCFLRNSKHQ